MFFKVSVTLRRQPREAMDVETEVERSSCLKILAVVLDDDV